MHGIKNISFLANKVLDSNLYSKIYVSTWAYVKRILFQSECITYDVDSIFDRKREATKGFYGHVA